MQLQLQQHDEVLMFASSEDSDLSETLVKERDYINACLRRPLLGKEELEMMRGKTKITLMHEEHVALGDSSLQLTFARGVL